MAIYPFEKSA